MTVTDEEFFRRLAGLVKDINNTIHYSARPSNFRGQGRIIELIARHEGCTQRELANLAQIKPGSLTQVLERLERNQYVTRRRNEQDRRIRRVYLTDQGRRFHVRLNKHRIAFADRLLSEVTPQEREQFIRVVDKMQVQLHKYYGEVLKNTERDEDK
ncbi:MAG: MarR family winged helix-turn-helix transcriptional regulator [Limosilactobacillus sp.]